MPRCPNGSRKNKKGICVPNTEKKIKKRKKRKNIKLIAPKKKLEKPDCIKLFELIKSNNDLLKLETKDFFAIKKCQSDTNRAILKTDKFPFLYPHNFAEAKVNKGLILFPPDFTW